MVADERKALGRPVATPTRRLLETVGASFSATLRQHEACRVSLVDHQARVDVVIRSEDVDRWTDRLADDRPHCVP